MEKNKNFFSWVDIIPWERTSKIMKVLIILLTTTMVSFASGGYSQTKNFTFQLKRASLLEVFEQIEQQSNMQVAYDISSINTDMRIDIKVSGESVEDVLNKALQNTDLSYRIMNRYIIISKRGEKSVNPEIISQQPRKISGKVTDDGGLPLPGVTVVVKGTTNGTITDVNGSYNLSGVTGDVTLVFSFVGMRTQEFQVGDRSVVNVKMMEETIGLDEVVAVGYGVQKKATLTGSISDIKGEELAKSPQPNLTNSLAGHFSGLIVTNRTGEPGYDGSDIYIRGVGTNGSTDILVVVDGVPGQIGSLGRLDPDDIESISVLKDASAAVYGSRAANGVILVTTKRGKFDQKPTLNFSFNQGFSSPTRLPGMADAATYAAIRNEIAYYNNTDGGLNQIYSDDEIQKFKDGSDPLNYPNTDWQKETLKDFALQNKANLSVSGGTQNMKYFVSLGTLYQDGIYKDGATKYNQYNFRSNLDVNVSSRLKVGLSLNGREEDRRYPTYSAGTIFRSIYRAYPTVAARYPNGLLSTGIEDYNPVAMVTSSAGWDKNPTYIFNGILTGKYDIPYIKGLSVDGFFSVDKSFEFEKKFYEPYILYDYDSSSDDYTAVTVGGSDGNAYLYEKQDNSSLITKNIKLNYEAHFGKHNVSAFVAYEQSKKTEETFDATRYNFVTTETPELSNGGSESTDAENTGSSSDYRRRSYIGRLSYNYNEKYMAEAQLRIDGSSIFPEGHRYGYFPGFSAGWAVSREPWFKDNIQFVNNLKLRASYGELGNDDVDAFQYYDNYTYNDAYVIGGSIHKGVDLTKLGNPEITWEVAKKTDVGINGTVFNNFSFEFIYFKQKRSDILTTRSASVPAVSGIVDPYDEDDALIPDENIGKINNTGFEATLGYNHSGKFSYRISGNVTYAKSKIINLDEASGTLSYQKETGRPLNTYLRYRAIGIFRTEDDLDNYAHLSNAQLGDLILEDYDGDGEITADDEVRSKYSNIPELTYGINLSADWNHFDLAVVFAGQARVSQYVLPESGTVGNFYSSWADNRWSPTNVNGSYPRVDTRASSSINGGEYPNTFWLNDASFLRLKSLELGYNLSSQFLSKLKISDLRFYVNGFNLFTITKVKDYDPEGDSESGQFYPQQRIINVGISMKL